MTRGSIQDVSLKEGVLAAWTLEVQLGETPMLVQRRSL